MAQEFYFAWVVDGNTIFGPEHYVQDEAVAGLEISHQEKEVPGMRIALRNPKVGLLNPARSQWAWVSWRRPDDVVVPLFHGRLVAMPTDLTQELIALEFHARPADYEEQKKALAATLKVAPYWDEVFIDEAQLEEPDVVLAARPALWHVGRTDKTLTISHILSGEDGSVVLDGSTVLGSRCDLQYGTPLDHIKVKATVEWTQSAFGTVDMVGAVAKAFGGQISSYTGSGLESTWPAYGTDIGGGWSVDFSLPGLTNTSRKDSEELVVPINPMNDTPPEEVIGDEEAYQKWLAEQMANPIREARFVRWDFRPVFNVRYEASRGRREIIEFTVGADVQRFFTDQAETPEDQDVLELQAVSTTVDKVLPSRKVRSYFETDRGQQTIAYLLNLASTNLLWAARAVQISVDIPWLIAIQLSCRHDILLSLPELPGGEAGGKVVGYQLTMDPQSGLMAGAVTFAAVVGRGNVLAPPAAGVESYVDDDYVEDAYQVFYGQSLQPVPGVIEYVRPVYKPTDDDIDFDNMTPETVVADLPATALLTFTGPGAEGDTVTMDEVVVEPIPDPPPVPPEPPVENVVPRTYTLREVLAAPNDVLLGLNAEGTAHNLTDAIEAVEGRAGVTYGTDTKAHASMGATVGGAIMRATARKGGVVGNDLAVSDTITAASWDQAHLYDGSYGLIVQNPAQAQESWMKSGPAPGSPTLAINKLNEKFTLVQLALVPVIGGPFETSIALEVSDLMVPQTIDLEAAPL